MASVAYNPDDPLQTAFLSALALGETGGAPNSATEGYGGVSLAGAATDSYGFPIWGGQGNTHAAGTFQFEPSTWDAIAQEYNLNFANENDQNEGAFYLAQQADPNLENDLSTGNFSAIQTALKSIWPSVTGNRAAPQGLAADLADSVTIVGNDAATQTAANNSAGGTASGQTGSTTEQGSSGFNLFDPSTYQAFFTQGALIIVGAVIILVALWMLLSSQGVVPSPAKLGKEALTLGA